MHPRATCLSTRPTPIKLTEIFVMYLLREFTLTESYALVSMRKFFAQVDSLRIKRNIYKEHDVNPNNVRVI